MRTGRSDPISSSLERSVVDTLLAESALTSEAAISTARLFVALSLLTRFFLIGAHTSGGASSERTLLVVPAGLLAVLFSIEFLRRYRNRRVTRHWLPVSVVIDAILCFVALLGNALYPGDDYRGALRSPDTALILIVVASAGFRLSIPLTLLSGFINLFAAFGLVYLDFHLQRAPIDYGRGQVIMWVIMMVAATAVAAISAWRTAGLAVRGARESLRRDRAQRDLTSILEGHHDAQSVLSSLMLNAGALVRALRDSEQLEAVRVSGQLSEDLDALTSCVSQVKQQAGQALLRAHPILETDLKQAITQLIPTLRDLVPQLKLRFVPVGEGPFSGSLAAGRNGLRRILENLLKNAVEGSGNQGASRAEIRLERVGERLHLTVSDDGPGWPPGDEGVVGSEKADGMGVGLSSVKHLVEASGGEIAREPSELGGASITARLPATT